MGDESHAAELVPAVSSALGPFASPDNAALIYLARFTTPKSKQTAIESLQRALYVLGVEAESWHLAPWCKLRPEQTALLYQRLQSLGYAPRTMRLTLTTVRGVLETAFRLGQIDGDTYMRATLWGRVRGERARAGRALTQGEIDTLRAYCERGSAFRGAMVWAIFALGLGGGLRREELRTVRADALSDDAKTLRVVGKGSKEALQPLPGWVGGAVEAWLAQRARIELRCPSLFIRVSKSSVEDRRMTRDELYGLIAKTGRAAGCKHFSPHDLRRTFATRLLDKEKPPIVKDLMRHALVSTTLSYDRSTEEQTRDAVSSLDDMGTVRSENEAPRVEPPVRSSRDT